MTRPGLLVLLAFLPTLLPAQASPYLTLEDPRLPVLEHLIQLGAVEDPTPAVRPFLLGEALRVLLAADTAPDTPNGRAISELRSELTPPEGETWWRAEGQGGAQAGTHARRDLLHPAGAGRTWGVGDLNLTAVLGPVAVASHPGIEPRVVDDPDWPGRHNVKIAGRLIDGYVSAQWKYARIFYGQMSHNWGPVGLPGIPLSNYGYERGGLGFELGTRTIRLTAIASDMRDERNAGGNPVHRYYFAHRLDLRLSRRVQLGAWETIVTAGADRDFESRYRNPLSISYLANTIGLGDRGNVMLGLDLSWKAGRAATIQAQLALDDFRYQDRSAPDRNPDRWALTVMGFGPLAGRAAWKAYYTQASSLAFRAYDGQFQNFTDGGVGIGRNFADNDQLSLLVTVPAAPRWLVTPELTVLRQGEGQLNDPYPTGTARGATPEIFIGVVEKTYRAAVGITGIQGPLRVTGSAGLHRVVNAGHVSGTNRTRFEGRITAVLGLSRQGIFPR